MTAAAVKGIPDPELEARRELREAADRLVAARRGQGLPYRVEDSATLAGIAALIAEPDKSNDRRSKQPAAVMSGGRNGRDDHSR
jgi:hypothetical protein